MRTSAPSLPLCTTSLPERGAGGGDTALELVTDSSAIRAADVATVFAHAVWTRGRSLDAIQRMLENTAIAVLARVPNGPVGFARVVTDQTFRAFIEDVVVVEHARGRGVGRAMIRCLEEAVRRLGVPRLDLTTQQVGFWQNLGYRQKPDSKCMVKLLSEGDQ